MASRRLDIDSWLLVGTSSIAIWRLESLEVYLSFFVVGLRKGWLGEGVCDCSSTEVEGHLQILGTHFWMTGASDEGRCLCRMLYILSMICSSASWWPCVRQLQWIFFIERCSLIPPSSSVACPHALASHRQRGRILATVSKSAHYARFYRVGGEHNRAQITSNAHVSTTILKTTTSGDSHCLLMQLSWLFVAAECLSFHHS